MSHLSRARFRHAVVQSDAIPQRRLPPVLSPVELAPWQAVHLPSQSVLAPPTHGLTHDQLLAVTLEAHDPGPHAVRLTLRVTLVVDARALCCGFVGGGLCA